MIPFIRLGGETIDLMRQFFYEKGLPAEREEAIWGCFNADTVSSTKLDSTVTELVLQSIDDRGVHLADA